MIAWIVLAIGIGIPFGLSIAAVLDRAAAKAPPSNSGGISVIGCDMSGRGPAEIDPRYLRMVTDVLQQPDSGNGFRTLLP
jgi:hypothetical protein